jgi:hypothetical protein
MHLLSLGRTISTFDAGCMGCKLGQNGHALPVQTSRWKMEEPILWHHKIAPLHSKSLYIIGDKHNLDFATLSRLYETLKLEYLI